VRRNLAAVNSTLGVGRWPLGRFSARKNKRNQFLFPDSLPSVRRLSLVSNHAVSNFKFCRGRADVNDLVSQLHKLVEIERPIVERARQPESRN
jgi:hypothetical protein